MCHPLFLKNGTDADNFIVCDKLFHVCSPVKAKTCLPNSDRGFGQIRFPADEECIHCLAAITVIWMHLSTRYDGTKLCRALYTVRHSLCVVALGASGGH